MRRHIPAYLAPIALILLFACSDDEPSPSDAGKVPTVYKDLTQKDHVLQNLELAWNNRNIEQYERLLDDDYTFFFDDGLGGGIPIQWGRADDVRAARNMFNPNYNGPNPITSIEVSLSLEAIQWIAQQPTDPLYAGETWYTTTVAYQVIIKALPDLIFRTTGNPKGQFTVREIPVDDHTEWRLVQWRDLGSSGIHSLRVIHTSTAVH